MPNWKKFLLIGGVILAALALLYLAFFFVFLELVVDFWWFKSLKVEDYFWLRLFYKYFISGGVTLLFFLVFFLNFWVASKFLGVTRLSHSQTGGAGEPGRKKLLAKFQDGALDLYSIVSLILAIIIAVPFYRQWESALLFLYSSHSGVVEPVYGNDVSFYLFSFPIYELIQQELLIVAVLLFVFIAFLYWLEHRIFSSSSEFPAGAKVHLTALVVLICLIVGWGFLLQRFGLLYESGHEPVFYGPGYIEIRYHLPLIWTALATFLCAAVSAIVFIHTGGERGRRTLMVFAVVFLLAIGFRHIEFIPGLLTKFIVQPNPVKAEKVFMENNIQATLDAYALDRVKTIEFDVSFEPENDLAKWVNKEHLQNIPVWDRELLDDVYNQLQGIRPYYQFLDVDEDRYGIDGHIQQVNLSAREMNIDKLPKEAQNWENIHLRYTHGYAAVMTPAAQDGGQPIDWYLRDLNLYSDVGFKIEHPDIFYGLEDYQYAIVPNLLKVVDISGTSSNPEATGDYAGSGGVPIRSLFRKLLFSMYYRDLKIFFSRNINDQSRLLLRRNVKNRIRTLTPYLALDKDPYLVISDDSLYWIQDAYTVSARYPVSQPMDAEFDVNPVQIEDKFNYIRNSVKVVVNAYNGEVDYYVVDDTDPIIRAYQGAYPGFFKSLAQMPQSLRSHLRYPRDIFYYQMKVYSKYHQVQPELFYQQAETWDFPDIESKPVLPYYLTTEIEGCTELDKFILVEPMTPIHRDNLSVVAIAGSLDFKTCGIAYSGTIAVYKFRKDIQVDGPAQVSALIDQDPVISEQFTLWDQHGSKVTRGRMVIMPLEHSVLYVQPIYLISTHTRIPELARVIVSMGNEVVMDKTLAGAFQGLEDKLRQDRAREQELHHNSMEIPGSEIPLPGLGPDEAPKAAPATR